MAAGRFRPEYDDPLHVTIGLWSIAHGLTSLLIAMPTFPWPDERFIDEHLLVHLRGLLADPDDLPGARRGEPASQASSGSADQSRSGDT
jgi:hypothetical protein